MDGLDFTGLSDDQLIALARGCCEEAVRRNPAVTQAMQDMMLTEAERARIARESSEAERAAARARERAAIARAAAEAARHEAEMQSAAQRTARAAEAAARAREKNELQQHRDVALLRQAAALVGRRPADISLLHCETRRGRRVFVNGGSERYARVHLVEFEPLTGRLSTIRPLLPGKRDLAVFCASLAELLLPDEFIAGATFTWPTETPA